MAYYKDSNSVREYLKLAKGYNGQKLIEKLKDHLSKNATILELGSGPGADIEILKQDYLVTGSDYSDLFLELLRKRYPKQKFLLLDAVTLETSERFDGIYSNKVLQHLTDEELIRSLELQADLLNPGGIICHSFWNGTDQYAMMGVLHNYHTMDELSSWSEKLFQIQLMETYTEMDENDSILLIARKK